MTRYTPYYCEENTWFALKERDLDDGHALFIVGGPDGVGVWSQAASPRPDGLTLWDYHVVALGRRAGRWHVLDPDCTAGSDLALHDWIAASFPFAGVLPAEIEPRFRPIAAERLFDEFHTDRSHMRDERGEWLAPPPPWPPLSDRSNLLDFLAVDGTIDLVELMHRFVDG